MSNFRSKFFTDFFFNIHRHEKKNWDTLRFPNGHPRQNQFMLEEAVQRMDFIVRNLDALEASYELLADEPSRTLFVKLLEYNVLDHHHVRLPLSSKAYWKACRDIQNRFLVAANQVQTERLSLHHYYLPEFDIHLLGGQLTVMTKFILRQYFFERGPKIRPEKGDVVLDGGSCFGDTALQFAQAVGTTGQVHAFEFVPQNLAIMRQNIDLNPGYDRRIQVAPYAMFNASGVHFTFQDRGPSTNLEFERESADGAETISIDDYVARQGLTQVDFIKMDIEGAEDAALSGAVETIRRFRPRLAISAYHKPDDMIVLPRRIRSILPAYRFYLEHYTIHREETVLYATANYADGDGREEATQPWQKL